MAFVYLVRLVEKKAINLEATASNGDFRRLTATRFQRYHEDLPKRCRKLTNAVRDKQSLATMTDTHAPREDQLPVRSMYVSPRSAADLDSMSSNSMSAGPSSSTSTAAAGTQVGVSNARKPPPPSEIFPVSSARGTSATAFRALPSPSSGLSSTNHTPLRAPPMYVPPESRPLSQEKKNAALAVLLANHDRTPEQREFWVAFVDGLVENDDGPHVHHDFSADGGARIDTLTDEPDWWSARLLATTTTAPASSTSMRSESSTRWSRLIGFSWSLLMKRG